MRRMLLLTSPDNQYISIYYDHHTYHIAGPAHPRKPALHIRCTWAPQHYKFFGNSWATGSRCSSSRCPSHTPISTSLHLLAHSHFVAPHDPIRLTPRVAIGKLAGYYHTRVTNAWNQCHTQVSHVVSVHHVAQKNWYQLSRLELRQLFECSKLKTTI